MTRPCGACLATFRQFLDIVDWAHIPEDITPSFSCQYFLALHKDVCDDTKLCPIGIGTHVHRILGAMETFAYAAEFAELLSPFQFGIAILGGMQLLTHCIQSLVYKHLPGSPIHTSASRALVLIDIVNMFNAASCLQCKHVLDNDDLLGIFFTIKKASLKVACSALFLHATSFTQSYKSSKLPLTLMPNPV